MKDMSRRENIDVSVIIPVYNKEKYLRECLNSIIAQTKQEIEIICVEDKSTDSSQDILDWYAEEDSRFVVVKNEVNKGAAKSRNLGLAMAKGDYVIFVDGDDFFDKRYIEELWNKCHENELDVCLCMNWDYWQDKGGEIKAMSRRKKVLSLKNKINDRAYKLTEIPETILAFPPNPWNKMCRKKFLDENGIRFLDLPSCNDQYFHDVCLFYAARIGSVTQELVYYRRGHGECINSHRGNFPLSIYTSLRRTKKELCWKFDWKKLQKYYNSRFVEAIVSELRFINSETKNRMIKFWKNRGLKQIGMRCCNENDFSIKKYFEMWKNIMCDNATNTCFCDRRKNLSQKLYINNKPKIFWGLCETKDLFLRKTVERIADVRTDVVVSTDKNKYGTWCCGMPVCSAKALDREGVVLVVTGNCDSAKNEAACQGITKKKMDIVELRSVLNSI